MKKSYKIITVFLCFYAIFSIATNFVNDEKPLDESNQKLILEIEQTKKQLKLYEELLSKQDSTIIAQGGVVNIAPSAQMVNVVVFGGIANIGIICKENNPDLVQVTCQNEGMANIGTILVDESMKEELKESFTAEYFKSLFKSLNVADVQNLKNFEKPTEELIK